MALLNFGQMKDMYQLQKKAKQMEKELKELEIEARSPDGRVSVVVSGNMKMVSIDIDPSLINNDQKNYLEKLLKETIDQAMSRAQSESAQRLQPLLKGMNLPGM